jgi:integrase
MRTRGTGTIEPCPGGFRARLPGRGAQRLPRVYGTEAEADAALDAALARLSATAQTTGFTLGSWGVRAIEKRETAGQRAAKSYRSVWRAHVEHDPLGAVPLREVTRQHVAAWVVELASRTPQPGHRHGDHVATERAKRPIAKGTAQNALNLLRVVLEDAVEAGRIEVNPARDVRLPTAIRKRKRTHKTWTYLLPDEQARLMTTPEIPLRERLALAFALGTGARQNEQWWIEVRDLDLVNGTVTLRHTKNGKPRTLPLLPIARAAAVRWLELRKVEAREHKQRCTWLWCTVRGHQRDGDHRDWQEWTEAVLGSEGRHDGRHVRWHDLRHTCATSLVQGWWGRTWTLQEVQVMLDHESITTTERYAHLDGGIARAAADLTRESPERLVQIDENSFAPPARFERTTFGLGRRRPTDSAREVSRGSGAAVVTSLAKAIRVLTTEEALFDAWLAEEAG